MVLALARGYDWLHDELDEDERTCVRSALLARTRQVADHVTRQASIQLFPFDSHAVRSVSSVLVLACMAMLDEEPEARDWLDFSVEFLCRTSNTVCGNVLRAGGDAACSLKIHASVQWLVTVPLSALLVLVLDLSVVRVFAIMLVDELVKALPFHLRMYSGRWKRRLVSEA